MIYQTHKLSNGIRLIHKPDNSEVFYCGILINTGSRDERNDEQGMAHFVEHMLFKGTKKRRAAHIINRLEDVGGELNAFTSKEETVVYATILIEYADRAIELLSDIVLHSTFPQKEIDKEVVIVLDEIQSYNDSPSELIYDDFEELLFDNHPIGRNILGKPEFLQGLTTENVNSFYSRNYRTEEMIFFSIGNLKFDTIVRKANKFLLKCIPCNFIQNRIQPQVSNTKQQTSIKNTNQIHCIIGGNAYDMYNPDRLGLYLLNNIVGGPGMNSLLNLSLREKHGLVYNVESTYQPFTDTGLWTIYFGCDPVNADKCEQLVYATLSKLRETEIPETKLKKYKLQLLGQMAISSENKENLAISMAKTFLRYQKVDSIEEIKEKINDITPQQLLRIANETYNPEKFRILKYK